MSDLSRAERILIAVLVVPLTVAAVAPFIGPRTVLNEIQTLSWPHRFSAQEWRAHPAQRWQMAGDLAQGAQLRGKTSAQVVQLLGNPRGGSTSLESPLVWSVPAPQRPNDYLMVAVEDGVVVGVALTNNLEMYR